MSGFGINRGLGGGHTGGMVMLLGVLLAMPAWGATHPMRLPQSINAPDVLNAYVEIAKGGVVKYEVDPATGQLSVDRFLPESFSYPQAYGFLPSVPAGDGDCLDVFILTDRPLQTQAVIEVRPVGMIRMRDGGEDDDKVLAMPTTGGSSQAKPTDETLSDLKQFLTRYKAHARGSNPVEWLGVLKAPETLGRLAQALAGARSDAPCGGP